MRRPLTWLVNAACLAGLLLAGRHLEADEPPKQSSTSKAPWQRPLQGEDDKKAAELEEKVSRLQAACKFEEALKLAQELAELRQQGQGADHWQAVNARHDVDALRRVLRQGKSAQAEYAGSFSLQREAESLVAKGHYPEAQPLLEKVLVIRCTVLGKDHPETATSYNNVASNLDAQGKYQEAEEGYRKALALRRKVLGEDHTDTARGYNNVAANLNAQGKYQEAEEGVRKALAICRKVLGEDHTDTARGYNNVAANLNAQGKYQEAEDGLRKALAIQRRVLGEDHPHTATSYNNLARNLNAQGKYQEAEEGVRKALAIRRKVLGEDHPDTATSYNDVAFNLNDQGKYLEAEKGFRKGLAICRKVLGEDHPDTALSYNNLAASLNAQGKYQEAEESFRKALAICRKVLGEDHLHTATSYNNVARNLNAQGKYQEAEEGVRKALAIRRKMLGEDHPDTAQSYNNGAANLNDQGKYQEAEEGYCKALAIRRKMLGEDHPHTATSYNNVAFNLNAQGKYQEAEELWLVAAEVFQRVRPRIAASGLGRSTKTGETSPLPSLAGVLARNRKPEAAWQRFEESLGRGTWDDLSARLRRSRADQIRQTQLMTQLDRLDQLIEKVVARNLTTPELDQRRKELLSQLRHKQDELDTFVRTLEKTYGPAAGLVFDRSQIQAALPADAALVGWLDLLPASPKAADPNGEHWAVLLRSAGQPVWERLKGSGPKEAWTDADTNLPIDLRTTLHKPRGAWKPLAQRLKQQRLEPLAKHLAAHDGLPAVRHLIVLPSTALPGVPVEVFGDGYTVSYALSGTLYAHLRQQKRPTSQGLFALADPVFDLPAAAEQPPLLPKGGVLLTMVVPGANAAQARLKPNDVLLRYNGTDLSGPADLKLLPESNDPKATVPVTYWRAGRTFDTQVRPGKLGVVLAKEPAAEALAEQRRFDQRLAASRSETWTPLPGTRAEVEALQRLFENQPPAKVLFGSKASEQELYELAKGELGQYRYLHLATHGEVDNRLPLQSAVVLARDHLPDPGKQLDAGLPIYTGKLTADKILRQWHLNCELVTLSACQTALGKYERGEGFIGFAHALILSGSRAVCLTLWEVDDVATTLLMERFYQNLLGKRDGLKAPLSKSKALAEAKDWLRGLSADEVAKRTAHLRQGVARAKGAPKLEVKEEAPAAPAKVKDESPYAHPYYWAAFVLIGDPD